MYVGNTKSTPMYNFINTGNRKPNLTVDNIFEETSYFPTWDQREKKMIFKYANADQRIRQTLDEALNDGVLEWKSEHDLEQFSKYKDLLPSDIHSW